MTSKTAVASKAAFGLAKKPTARRATAKAARPSAKVAFMIAKPIVLRRIRQSTAQIVDAAATVAEAAVMTAVVLATYGPDAAVELGLVEPPPKPKPAAPRVIAGVVIGASAVYFLDPAHGQKRRDRIAGLMK
jgi:hypothetical protein